MTGSQHLYGEAVLERVAAPLRPDRGLPRRRARAARAHRVQASGDQPGIDRRRPARGGHRARVRRGGGLDAHVLAGQDVDRWPDAACASRSCTCTRSSIATCPGPTIDMDFMNLNQSAHGDREFAFIQTPAAAAAARRSSATGRTRRSSAGSAHGPGRPPAWHDAQRLQHRPVRRQHARGGGDRGRQGGGAGSPRLSRSTGTVSAISFDPCRGRRATPMSTTWCDDYLDAYDVVAALRPGGDRPPSLRTAARIEAGLRALPRTTVGSARSPIRSRTWHARAAARDRRPAADGRRLRLRRGGRLEGGRAGAHPEGHG